jgi:fatty acid-binding protein DegV
MDQRRGLQGMVRALASQVTAGDAVHFWVQRRHNLVEGGRISRAQAFE